MLLTTKYNSLAHKKATSTKSVRVWSKDKCEELRACFDCTDWSVFTDGVNSNNIDDVADCVTDYINFCTSMIIPCKTIKVFSNNKPWVTKEIKNAMNVKKAAFMSRNKEEIKLA